MFTPVSWLSPLSTVSSDGWIDGCLPSLVGDGHALLVVLVVEVSPGTLLSEVDRGAVPSGVDGTSSAPSRPCAVPRGPCPTARPLPKGRERVSWREERLECCAAESSPGSSAYSQCLNYSSQCHILKQNTSRSTFLLFMNFNFESCHCHVWLWTIRFLLIPHNESFACLPHAEFHGSQERVTVTYLTPKSFHSSTLTFHLPVLGFHSTGPSFTSGAI